MLKPYMMRFLWLLIVPVMGWTESPSHRPVALLVGPMDFDTGEVQREATRERGTATSEQGDADEPAPTADVLATGERVYAVNCAFCHGDTGDGRGPGASRLSIKPRDFTQGLFKFRSTPTGSLPLDSDLFRTISQGLRGTGMIAWQARLTEEERWRVVHYLKRFSPRFTQEQPAPAVPVSEPPPQTPELKAKGREVYQSAECWQCHGQEGLGDGPSAGTLKDAWGHLVRPTDFVKGPLKRGETPAEVYRTLVTGLDGSPMPSFAEALAEEERWAVVAYIRSRRDPRWAQRRFPEERMGELLDMIGPMQRMMGGNGGQ